MNKLFRVVPAVFLVLLALLPAQAQGQNMSRMWEFTPKMGASGAFVEAIRSHMEYRESLGDPWSWWIYEVVVGEDVGKIIAASWNHTWADFDAYDAWEGGLAAGSHFQANVLPLVEEMTTSIHQGIPEIEKRSEDPNAEHTLVMVQDFYLEPGGQQDFNQALGKFHEAMVAAEVPFYYATSFLVAGGRGPSFTIAGLGGSWADFADPDPNVEQVMVEHYGEEEAMEIFQQFSGAVEYFETTVVRYREDLSNVEGM